MLHRILLTLISICLLSGCLGHSLGPKNLAFDPEYAGAQVDKDKAFYIAVVEPFPADASDSPAFIALQFSKTVSPAVREAVPGALADSVATGIQAAKEQGSDYFVALSVTQWKAHSILSPGYDASLTVTVLDAKNSAVLSKATVEATCYASGMGLELSTRECIRPQIDLWAQKAFSVGPVSEPWTDPNTFPKFR